VATPFRGPSKFECHGAWQLRSGCSRGQTLSPRLLSRHQQTKTFSANAQRCYLQLGVARAAGFGIFLDDNADMTTSWSVRRVNPDDAVFVAAHGAFKPSDAARRSGYAAWLKPRIESGTYVGWLAIGETKCVVAGAGAILLDWGPTRSNPCGTMARIVNVFTDDAWRLRGVSRTLLKSVLADCEALGVREFNLGATADARSLYSSLGFQNYPAEMRRRVPAH
jgi:GNAT superfamily N-acetyltransferase